MHCGCSILGTIHAADMLELQQKEQLRKWVEQKIFERYVILKKDDEGRRHFMIYDGTWEKYGPIDRSSADTFWNSWNWV